MKCYLIEFYYIFNVFVILLLENCSAYFNKDIKREDDFLLISISLMQTFNIYQGIVVDKQNNKTMNLNHLKEFSVYYVPVTYKNEKELLQYFFDGDFPIFKIAIIVNEENILDIARIFRQLEKLDILHRISSFTWLVFIEKELTANYEDLLVPYNCEFIMIHSRNYKNYKLTEVYKLKNRTILFDFGTWDHYSGKSITNLSFLKRRINLNGTELLMEREDNGRRCYGRGCSHEEIIDGLGTVMNFRFLVKETLKRNIGECRVTNKETDVPLQPQVFHPDFYKFEECDLIVPVFALVITWHIKDPLTSKDAYYYIEPFDNGLWISILVFVIISSTTTSILFVIKKSVTKNKLKLSLIDCIFMVFESFCNEDGCPSKSTFHILLFTFRFAALFVSAVYCSTICSFLAVQIPTIPFKNLEGFARNNEYLLCAFPQIGELPKRLLSSSNNLILKNAFEKFEDVNRDEIVDKVCHHKYAVIAFNGNTFKIGDTCKVYDIEEPIFHAFTGNALPKHSPFTKFFNYGLLLFYTSGIHGRMERRAFKAKPADETIFEPVEIDQMTHVLSITIIGVIISLIILFFEIICLKIKYSKIFHRRKNIICKLRT